MDIQLLINAPGNAAGSRTASTDAKAPGNEFARHLAGASQAQEGGAGTAVIPTSQTSTGQADTSLTPLAAAHGQGEASADATTGQEALKALLAKASGETAPQVDNGTAGKNAASADRLAPLLDSSAEGVEAALLALVQGNQRPNNAEDQDSVAASLQALIHNDPQTDDPKAAGNGVWDALQERLALIEQAGRPEANDTLALLPQVGAVSPAGAKVPSTANPAGPGEAGQAVRTNPLLEAIAADRRSPTGSSPANAAALSAAAERLSAQGSGQATAMSDETLRLAATGDALLAQRGETSRTAGGLELAGQGAANAVTGTMNSAAGSGTAGALTGTAATPAPASLSAPIASPAWSQQLGQQLVRLSQHGGEQRVELKLHPAELGPLSVSLKMSDHGAQAQFVSAHAQVRQALEQAIPQLREALAEQGISLGETSVGEQRQGGSEGEDASGRPGEMVASTGSDAAEDGTAVTLEERGAQERALDGRVDLYA